MSTLSCRALAAMLLAGVAWAQDSPIVKAVEPEWGFPPGEVVVTAPLWVDLVVAPEGKIVDVRTEADIPAPMVRALQQYEMRPDASAYGVGLALEWKAPLRGYTGPPNGWPADVASVVAEAKQLDAAKAGEWEARLTDELETIAARSALVAWSAGEGDAEARAMRVRHVAWLVEHAPEAEVLRHTSAWVDAASNPQGYIRIRQLWLAHFRSKRANAKTIGAAAMFLRAQDPGLAESLLSGGANVSFYATPELGALYATQALAGSEFGTKARAALAGSTDVRLLRGAWRALTDKRVQALAAFEGVCADVIRQLKAVQPGAPGSCIEREFVTTAAPTVAAPNVDPNGRVRMSAFEQSKAILKAVRPEYPRLARDAGVQGKVIFTAIIGKDGKVKTLNFVSGHPMLRPSAEFAVKEWMYKPLVLNGEAVEVVTDIEVNFTIF